MTTRRRFLLAGSAAVVGAAVTGHIVFNELPRADAAPPEERFAYRGREVVITPAGNAAHATVNGRHGLHLERSGNEFITHLLPFSSFSSPRQLVQAVIDAEDAGLLVI